MRKTRPQLLWIFQAYLDKLQIMDPERRERLSCLYLERGLSRDTEKQFNTWLTTNHIVNADRPRVMRTRSSRLALFYAWLNQYRPFADTDERQRLTRLYHNKQISRDIEREFHRYVREKINDGRVLP